MSPSHVPLFFKGLNIGSLRTRWPWPATLDLSPIGAWRRKAVPWWTEWRRPSSGPTTEKPTCSATASSGGLTKATKTCRPSSARSRVTHETTASGRECRPTWMMSSAGEKVHACTWRCKKHPNWISQPSPGGLAGCFCCTFKVRGVVITAGVKWSYTYRNNLTPHSHCALKYVKKPIVKARWHI